METADSHGESQLFNLRINLSQPVTLLNAKLNQPLMLVIQNTTWTTLYQISV